VINQRRRKIEQDQRNLLIYGVGGIIAPFIEWRPRPCDQHRKRNDWGTKDFQQITALPVNYRGATTSPLAMHHQVGLGPGLREFCGKNIQPLLGFAYRPPVTARRLFAEVSASSR
jgi:hypothetical protein